MALFIFDFDGTLADTKTLVKNGLVDFSKENSLPIPDVEAICCGYSNPDLYDFKWGVGKEKQKEIMDIAFQYISAKIVDGSYIPELFSNTKEILEELDQKGSTIALCTSREKFATVNILKYYNIDKYFKAFRTRDDVKERNKKPKPDPELLLEIIEELGFNNKNAFMVGDTDADILAGKNANIKTVGVAWGYYTKEELDKYDPDYIIDDFMKLKGIL